MSSYKELVSGETPVLVDFSAEWCQPCQMLKPILQDVASKMGDKVKIIKIDVDKNNQLAGQLGIQGVPTMILYKGGKSVWRQSGVLPSHDLIQIIESHA
jgi:thioredoxin 1